MTFIHHETRSARRADPSGGAGYFDVLEDSRTGIYVSNANTGLIARVDSVAEGIAEAERLADKYDADQMTRVQSKILGIGFDARNESHDNAITPEFLNAIRIYRSPDDVEFSLADQFHVIADRIEEDSK